VRRREKEKKWHGDELCNSIGSKLESCDWFARFMDCLLLYRIALARLCWELHLA
jgi:hypothetical protein